MPSKRASAMHRNSLATSHKSAGDTMVTEDGYMLDYAILPRRKAGQINAGDRCPVRLTKDVLEKYFCMPLIRASKELGICATAIKKVCRKLGILKWPFRDRHLTVNSGLEDKVCIPASRERTGTKSRSERASSTDSCMSKPASTGSSASLVSASSVSSPATDDSGRDENGDTLPLIKPDLDDAVVDVLGDYPAYSENCGSCGAADETERLQPAPLPACDEDERYWSDAATVMSDAALDRLGSPAEHPHPAAAAAGAGGFAPLPDAAPADAPAGSSAHDVAAAAAGAACVSVLPAHPYDADEDGVAASAWSSAARDAACGEEDADGLGGLYAPCAAEWALACLLCGDSEPLPLPLPPPAADLAAAAGAPAPAPAPDEGGAAAGAGLDDAVGFYAL